MLHSGMLLCFWHWRKVSSSCRSLLMVVQCSDQGAVQALICVELLHLGCMVHQAQTLLREVAQETCGERNFGTQQGCHLQGQCRPAWLLPAILGTSGHSCRTLPCHTPGRSAVNARQSSVDGGQNNTEKDDLDPRTAYSTHKVLFVFLTEARLAPDYITKGACRCASSQSHRV